MSGADQVERTDATTGNGPSGEEGFSLLVSGVSGPYVTSLAGHREVIIGRSSECDVVIEDASISRRHARLVPARADDAWKLEDLGSSNGSRMHGARLTRHVPTDLSVGMSFELGSVTLVLQRTRPLLAAQSIPAPPLPPASDAGEPVVHDPTMKGIYAMLGIVARSPLTVLILGETGVGKDVYASEVHRWSERAGRAFLHLNCAALPESMLEAELFGYEKGAFTGAIKAKAGLFEAANGGTAFLDEIGEIPRATQAKLLHVLESREVFRMGALKAKTVDVRFIAATNQDLRKNVANGTFRADLYYRLNGISVTLPPLRSRPTDILPLAGFFAKRAASLQGKPPGVSFTDEAAKMLLHHGWPGNVRELRNLVDRVVAMSTSPRVGVEDLVASDREGFGKQGGERRSQHAPRRSSRPPAAATFESVEVTERLGQMKTLRRELKEREKETVISVLEQCGGNQTQAAKLLGVSRQTLINRIAEYKLARPRKPR